MAGLQLPTAVGPVVTVLQVVVVYELLGDALAAVQAPAGVGPVPVVAQVVKVQLLPLEAAAGVQLDTSVGPVVTVSQVMLPPGVQLPTGPGEHSSVLASQERSCEVLRRTWLVEIWS